MNNSTKSISEEKYNEAIRLFSFGYKIVEVSKLTGINRSTLSNWIVRNGRIKKQIDTDIPLNYLMSFKDGFTEQDKKDYSYLLGLYLGDGCIYKLKRTEKITITLDKKYEKLNEYTINIFSRFFNKDSYIFDRSLHNRGNAIDVIHHSSHLSLIFPQHGIGKKHNRDVSLKSWQESIIDDISLVKGLIMSDGTYYLDNQTNIKKYSFSNKSKDIIDLMKGLLIKLNIDFKLYNKVSKYELVIHSKNQAEKLHNIIGDKENFIGM